MSTTGSEGDLLRRWWQRCRSWLRRWWFKITQPKAPAGPPAFHVINRAMEEIMNTIEDQVAVMHRVLDTLSGLGKHLGELWLRNERLRGRYYALLRSLLEVVEQFPAGEQDGRWEGIRIALERILEEEGICEIPTKEGDPFCSEMHCCEQGVVSDQYPEGTVVQVLQRGFFQRTEEGKMVVVQPVRVIVAKRSSDKGCVDDAAR